MGTQQQELQASCELIEQIIQGYLDGKPYPPCGELRQDMRDGLRLLAAAPDMLAALKEILAYANAYSDHLTKLGFGAEQLGEGADSSSVAGMARAAIAKAEGR